MYPSYKVRNLSLLDHSQFTAWTQTAAGTSVASLGKRMKKADEKEHHFTLAPNTVLSPSFLYPLQGSFPMFISTSGLLMSQTFYGISICIELLLNYDNLNLTSWPIQYVLHLLWGRKKHLKGDMDLFCSCCWDKALWRIYCRSTFLSSGLWRTVGTLKLNGLKKY